MFTSFDKFLAAIVGFGALALNNYGVLPEFVNEAWLNAFLLVITPAAVYFFRNKVNTPIKFGDNPNA